MDARSENVTFEEYQYLQSRVILFPDLPNQADSIKIHYYHDGFLPDYSLTIEFRVPLNTPINSNTKYWIETSRNKNFKWIAYENGDS